MSRSYDYPWWFPEGFFSWDPCPWWQYPCPPNLRTKDDVIKSFEHLTDYMRRGVFAAQCERCQHYYLTWSTMTKLCDQCVFRHRQLNAIDVCEECHRIVKLDEPFWKQTFYPGPYNTICVGSVSFDVCEGCMNKKKRKYSYAVLIPEKERGMGCIDTDGGYKAYR